MIKWLLGLGAVLFGAMWFLGADHGQYINPPQAVVDPVAAEAPAKREVFVPAAPAEQTVKPVVQDPVADATVAQPPVVQVPVVEAPVGLDRVVQAPGVEAPMAPDAVQAPPDATVGVTKLMHAPAGASVRSGPGLEFPVIGAVGAGDVVMVVQDGAASGWVRVAVDGGGPAWVMTKLLRE